uniref:Endonuclease n=4 Tax=unclassified bacterial viruses TaxID=12333 RepID=A0AAU6W0R1_9VIRU
MSDEIVGKPSAMRKLARSTMPSWKVRQVKVQGGLCPLCNQPIDLKVKGEGAIDHDHATGEIRGVLHRSCNAAEGKVANAAGRWGAKSMEYSVLIPWLERLLDYLKKPGCGMIYHNHLTEDEKRLKRNATARKARATRKASSVVRRPRNVPEA